MQNVAPLQREGKNFASAARYMKLTLCLVSSIVYTIDDTNVVNQNLSRTNFT
jgi:hypothetical protein